MLSQGETEGTERTDFIGKKKRYTNQTIQQHKHFLSTVVIQNTNKKEMDYIQDTTA
jgi:hypothetical protein